MLYSGTMMMSLFFNVNAMLKMLSPGQGIKRYPSGVQFDNQKVFFVHQVLRPNTLGAFLSLNKL